MADRVGRRARRQVVVIGVGFAGFQAAAELGRRYLTRWADVTVIDRRDYILFTPLLYEAATGVIQARWLEYPVREILERQRIEFREETVTGIDLAGRRVQIGPQSIGYDHLVLTAGSQTNYFGSQTLAASTLPLKTAEDAERLLAHVKSCAALAGKASGPERLRLLTFAIVGAGPTGVELAASLHQALQERLLPARSRHAARVVLLEARDTILTGMSDRLGHVVEQELTRDGVEIVTGSPVTDVTREGYVLAGRPLVPAATVIWTAGVRPALVPGLEACPRARDGRLLVDEFLSLPDHPEVSVAGDTAGAAIGGRLAPANAPAAIRMGKLAARNVTRRILGLKPVAFQFRSEGELVQLGRHNAAALLGGRVVTGRSAWMLRRGVYIANLMGMTNRIGLAADWIRNERIGAAALRAAAPQEVDVESSSGD